MFSYLPLRIQKAVRRVNANLLYEFRIRANRPVMVNYGGNYRFLAEEGVSDKNGMVASKEEIEAILLEASEHSFYSVTEELRNGYLTTSEGERIGVAGKGICEEKKVLSMADIDSLCIRIPHLVSGASGALVPHCLDPELKSTLIIAKPGRGKTTILRDIVFEIDKKLSYNVVVIDDRGEFTQCRQCTMCDILSEIPKEQGISYAIRALRPDVIVVDELLPAEFSAIQRAMGLGVFLFASMHGDSLRFAPEGFARYVLLGDAIGSLSGIYDKDKNRLYA